MPSPYQPSTLAIAQQIASYLASQTYPLGGNVYTFGSVGINKDLGDLLPPNGTNAVSEVIGTADDSQRHAIGGKMRDTQSFQVLSIVDFTNGPLAEEQIMNIRDAIMPQFAKHVSLEDVGNVLVAKYKQGSGRFTHVIRAAKPYRAHSFELSVLSEWVSSGGFIA